MQKTHEEMELRDLGKQPLSEAELDELIGTRDYRLFLNAKNEIYRERKMKEKPPPRAEAVRLMAKHPNLIRRPIVIARKRMVIGYDEDALRSLA